MNNHTQSIREMKKEKKETDTPPATPPAKRDLQMLRTAWLGALTPSLANFASSARFTIVDTAADSVLFTSSDAIDTQKSKSLSYDYDYERSQMISSDVF